MERGLDANALIQGIYADAPDIRPKFTGVERIEAVEFAPMTPPNVLDDLATNNYTQTLQDSQNPSAFPLLATNEILAKFPPTMLRAEEFDTLRAKMPKNSTNVWPHSKYRLVLLTRNTKISFMASSLCPALSTRRQPPC